jgi:hypothetical protein
MVAPPHFGLDLGSAMVGNFGTWDHLTFTAVGAPLDHARALARQAHALGISIATSRAVALAAGRHFRFRLAATVALGPNGEPQEVYELVERLAHERDSHPGKLSAPCTRLFGVKGGLHDRQIDVDAQALAARGLRGWPAARSAVRASHAPRRASRSRCPTAGCPWAAGNSPVTQYMIGKRLFEKYAADLRLRPHGGLPHLSRGRPASRGHGRRPARHGHVGQHADAARHRGAAAFSLASVAEGRLRFLLCTRKDSPIRNVQDLKGKTVGTLVGADPYNAFTQILRYELGNPDPAAHGIRMVHLPTLPEAAQVPSGVGRHPGHLSGLPEGAGTGGRWPS